MEIERVKEKILEGRPGFPRQYGPDRADHQPGIPFFPQEATRDFVVIFLLTAIMFFLSAYLTPFLGPARSPQISELIVPDWYLLFSWGLLKIADIFPQFVIGPGTPLETRFDAAFWGDLLSGIPVIFLLLVPFLDRGRETRPAKAPVRSAVGLGFIIAWTFTASLYSIREVVAERWQTPDVDPSEAVSTAAALIPDDTMKMFFLVPPILVGLASYVALRRLGFAPMRRWIVPLCVAGAAIAAGHAAAILALPGWLPPLAQPYALPLAGFLAILGGSSVLAAAAVVFLPESRARKAVLLVGAAGLALFLGLFIAMDRTDPIGLLFILGILYPNMNTLLFLPSFVVLTAWFGLRRPYSTYEFLLNECYQCGKCHTVCPVTKVEDDALGGLNLVYNTFKKQHDGVPLWTCLACDACSAVCPLDIKYSDYILEERAKSYGRLAADGGGPE
jgi:ferredoxin